MRAYKMGCRASKQQQMCCNNTSCPNTRQSSEDARCRLPPETRVNANTSCQSQRNVRPMKAIVIFVDGEGPKRKS